MLCFLDLASPPSRTAYAAGMLGFGKDRSRSDRRQRCGIEDAGDFEVVAEGRVIEVAVADGSAVLERETAGDSTKGWTWGFFLRCFLLPSHDRLWLWLSGFEAVLAFDPLSLQAFNVAQVPNLVVRNTVAAVKTELIRMATLEDQFFGL